MTTVTLRIQVDKSGASEGIRAVKDDLQGVGQGGQQAGQQASGGINTLRGALDGAKAAVASFLAVYAGIQALSGVVRLADEYQSLSDRLRLATGDSAAFAAAQQGVFAVAQQTGTALSAVGGLYVSLSNSTRELGLSQSDLLTITQAISQSFVVSGASAAQTDAAVRQLSQGFASGVLRGDEFNSMMENAPALAAALAASLGVTTGQLRAMAAEGQLTSDVLATGLLNQAPQIAAQFDQMGTTVGQAFTRLSNAVLQFVGEANQATGAGAALAAIITGLANNLPAFVAGLTAVAAGYAAVSLQAVAANAGLLTTTGLVAGLSAALGLLVAAYAGYKLGEYLVNEVALVQAAVRSLYVGLSDAWTAIKVGAIEAFQAIRVAWITVVDAIQDRLADLIDRFVAFSEIELPFGLRADFAYGQADAFRELAAQLRSATDATTEIDNATGFLQQEVRDARAAAESYAASMFDAVDEIQNATSATNEARSATSALVAPLNSAANAAGNAAGGMADVRRDTANATNAVNAMIPRINVITSGLGAAATAAGRVDDGMRDAAAGAQEFTTKAASSASQAQAWGLDWGRVVDDVSTAFGDFVAGGLRDFESFADSLKNIARQIMSDLVAQFARRIVMNLGVNTSGGGGAGGFDLSSIFGGMFGGGGRQLPTTGGAGGFGGGGSGGAAGGIMGGGNMMANGFSMGGMMGAAGGIAMGLQGIRTGNALQGAAGGALAGFQIGGPWGALIGGIIGGLGALIRGDKPPDFRVGGANASVRNPEGSFETVFGRVRAGSREISWESLIEPIQQFDQAISDLVTSTGGGEEQLDAIASALSRWSVDLRDSAATAENVLGSRFNAVLTAFSADVREFVGNAGTVEERMGRLADALTIERIAGNENGITNSFDEMADLLLRFRVENENLADTFTRLGAGLALVDDAMLLLEATFSGTRLEAATFAGELIQLAGGFEQFAGLLSGALQTLFSEEERNQFLADQAQQALNQSLRDLNISGVGLDSIRTQLRDQLRSAMEAGNAELVNQILIAANQLGAFSTALEALGEDAVAAAQQVALGGTSLRPGGSLGGDAGTGSGGTATAPATQLAAGQETVRVLNSHTGLLQQIATNTAIREEPGAEKAARDTASAAAAQLAVMREIKQILEAEARSAVQAALKATTGANGSGVKRRAVSA